MKLSGCSLIAIVAAAAPVFADEADADRHGDIEEVVVQSRPIATTQSDLAQNISVISGEALDRLRSDTLGATLDSLPGLSQTAFGPSASRPIIRGLSGNRIRILTAGLGTIDASSTSVDHALALEPELIDRVEVLRGPATLLYGNDAAGGVVNVFDGRIPTRMPEGGADGHFNARYGINGDAIAGSGAVTAGLSDRVAFHIDASYLDRGDIEIPGSNLSDALRASLSGEELEEAEEGETDGFVANTFQERLAGAAGFTLFQENGFIGFSVSGFDNDYGLPVSEEEHGHGEEEEGEEHGEEEEGEEEGISIAQEQIRFDLQGEWNYTGFIEQVKFRFAYADYNHVELEGDEIGTRFDNEGFEGRLELVHEEIVGLNGAFGVQYRDRDLSAIGAEAFLPPSTTQQFGAFALETYENGPWRFEAGARLEVQEVDSPDNNLNIDDTTVSASLSGVYSFGDTGGWSVGLSGFRTERAPSAEELLSNGPHLAVGLFEIGDPSLGIETGTGFEAVLRKTEGDVTGSVAFFYTSYDDFIFLDITAEIEDGLPVANFGATDAEFWGFEAAFDWRAYEAGEDSLTIGGSLDYVRATDTDNDTGLPRIPPLTAQVSATYISHLFDFYTSISFTDSQTRVSGVELPTDSFWLLAAGVTVHPWGDESPVEFYLEGRNLLDEDVRFHTSFLKDTVPAPGADARIGIRAFF